MRFLLRLTCFLFCAAALGQPQNAASLSGIVTTTWGIAVPNARLTLTNRQGGVTLKSTSNPDGQYQFPDVAPGDYDFVVHADGFWPYSRFGIRAGERGERVEVVLETGKDGPGGSVSQLEATVAGKPGDDSAHFNLGRAYLSAGNLEKARAQFEKAVELRPDSIPARIGLAQAALRSGDARSALKYAQDLLKLQPDNGIALLLSAAACRMLGQYDQTGELLARILKSDPDNRDALLESAVSDLYQKKYAEAETLFRRAYRVDPSNLSGLLGLVEIHFLNNEPDQAVQVIAAEAEKEPRRPELRRELATAEAKAKYYDKAIADYQSVLPRYQDSPVEQAGVYGRLAEVYAQTGDLPHAIDNMKKATELAPGNAAFMTQLAGYYDAAGKKQEAIAGYRSALRFQPDNAIVMNNLAFLLANTGGDLDDALRLVQRARLLLPNLSEILDTTGWIYLKKDMTDSAARIFADLVQRFPANPMFHYHFALALSKKGDREGAIKELDAALLNHPGKDDEAEIRTMRAMIGQGK